MPEGVAPAAVRVGWWWQAAVLGGREYRANNPLRVSAATLLPRAVLQTIFLVLLGEVTGGVEARRYAIVGAAAVTATLSTMVGISDVPSDDQWSGTFGRIRTARLAAFTVLVLRCWPYPVAGWVTSTVALAAVAAIDRPAGLPVAALLGCFALLAVTSTAAGLAGAALAVGRRADVVAGNLLAYLTILASASVVPPGRIGWVDALGSILPMRHGLAALRAVQAGRPALGDLLLEVAVGVGWLAVTAIVVAIQTHRARVTGQDDYA